VTKTSHGGAASAAGWSAALITFWYAANYPFVGESDAIPLALGVAAAIVVAGAVEASWRRLRTHRLHDRV
jgi:hypothetical protein